MAMQKRVKALHQLWHLLSRSEFRPVEAALKVGAIPLLVQCPSFGSPDEQCVWALGNVTGEGEELRYVLPSQGALPPLARMMLLNKGSTVRTAAWTLSNLTKIGNISHSDPQRFMSNLVAGDSHATPAILIPGHEITDDVIKVLVKCLKSEHRVLKKEAAWVLSNIAAGSIEHKQLIYSSEALPLLLRLPSLAPFYLREVAYVLGNICVAPTEGGGKANLVVGHLVSLVQKGCLFGLVRSADAEAARLGLQLMELL